MLGFYDPLSECHRPLYRIAGGELRPTFETTERIGLLLDGLACAGVALARPEVDDTTLRRALARVHDPDYLGFLEHGFAIWSRDPKNGPELRTSLHSSRLMGRKPTDFLGLAGYYQADSTSVLCEGTWASARASAGTVLAALAHVQAGKGHGYALCRPPGHHAYRDQAGGFCYLNNAAIAAAAAAKAGARVAVLDIDVHHGNGTQGIFYDRADVLTVSVHADPATTYPFYAGYADETGAGAGEGGNLNLTLPPGSGFAAYAEAMAVAVARIRDHGTDFLVISLGLDTYVGDPFAVMALQIADFAPLGALCNLGVPTLVVQEGGYPSPQLGTLLSEFLKGLCQ